MKQLFTGILALLSVHICAQIPNYTWAKQNGDGDFEQAAEVVVDAQGNVYSCGKFESTVDFNPAPGSGNNIFALTSDGGTDGYLQKLDSAGNFVWALKIGGSSADDITSVTIDGSGNVVVTGYFTGVVDVDPSNGNALINSSPTWISDLFVISYSAQGQLNWARSFGGVSNEQSTSVKLSNSGRLLIGGAFEGTVDFDPGIGANNQTANGDNDAFLLLLSSTGNFVDVATFGGIGFEIVTCVAADASGNMYAAGQFEDTVDFDPGTGTYSVASSGRSDAFVMMLNSTGNFVWAGAIGGVEKDGANDIDIDAAGHVYLIGKIIGTADADPGAGVFTLTDSLLAGGCMVVKLNNTGTLAWAYLLSNTDPVDGTSIDLGPDGLLYLGLNFFGTLDADPSAATTNFVQSGSSVAADMLYLQNDTAGNYFWGFSIGGIYEDFVSDIFIAAGGELYTTGQYMIAADFDPGTATVNLTSAWQNNDVFVARYTPFGVGINDPRQTETAIRLFPNPANGNVTIDLGSTLLSGTIRVTDATGRIVASQKFGNTQFVNLQIDAAKGVYWVNVITNENQTATSKLIITN
jgi:Secretion system C-terminal sorting domain